MFSRIFFLLCVLFSVPLPAKLEDHLKKAFHKGKNHQIQNVDFIYMINLDERPEKFAASAQQLQPYGIHPYRFSAVNGWKISLEDVNDVGVKYKPGMRANLMGTYYPLTGEGPKHEIMSVPGRTYFCHCMSRGAIGCVLSHASVLQDALKSRYKTVWIMEDDISVVRDPRVLSSLITELDRKVGKKNWDILFTDRDTISNATGKHVPCHGGGYVLSPDFTPDDTQRFSVRTRVSANLRRIGARFGAYSYIIRQSGMKKILHFIKEHHIFIPFDLAFYQPSHIKIYTVLKDVVSTRRFAPSDNGGPTYQNKGKRPNN